MDRFEISAMEVRFIMVYVGLALALIPMIFNVGDFKSIFIGFGLTTLILNMVTIFYKLRKWDKGEY